MSQPRPRSRRRLLDDTLLVGLLMIVGALVVLYLAFRAQVGLPWEPMQRIEIAVQDGGKLQRYADVRIGGARVGQVVEQHAVARKGEVPPHSVLDVQLEGDARDLPVDSTVEVRLASVLGGKYVSLVPGESEETVPEGGRLPLENAKGGVDIEDALGVFDPEGREAARTFLRGAGDALAGRGADINDTIGATARLLPGLQRVLATLVAPRTDLDGLLTGLASGTRALAGHAPQLAMLVGDLEATLGALDASGDALGRSIAELPALGREATAALGTIGPVLVDAAAVADSLRPAAGVLEGSLREVDATMRTAIRVDPKLASLAQPLERTLASVEALSANPSSTNALRLLGSADLATFGSSAFVGLGAILSTAWEAEEHCGAATLWMQRLSQLVSDGDEHGNWIRMIPFFQLDESQQSARPAPELHANPYPILDDQECEAGHEPYAPGQQIGNPPGLQGAGQFARLGGRR